MRNILTFDVEDWYHGNFLDQQGADDKEERVVNPTLEILNLLQKSGNTATFFVLGSVAEKYPALIKEIARQGHEVASHGYDHRLVYKLTPPEFEKDVALSIKIIEKITAKKILGYRAPYWSVTPAMDWATKILSSLGLVYDSSIYPFKTYLYGDNRAPRFKHVIYQNGKSVLLEIPPTVLELRQVRIPFCGGFYFRLLPLWLIRFGIKKINKKEGQPIVFYLHPYEIDPQKTNKSKGMRNNFILQVNLKKAKEKLHKLLEEFEFISIQEYLAAVEK